VVSVALALDCTTGTNWYLVLEVQIDTSGT